MITVVGLGFVGLTVALGFAHFGQTVYGIEKDLQKSEVLQQGETPFLEPGFQDAMTAHLNHNFFVLNEFHSMIAESEAIFYCVGTPCKENGEADLSALFQAIQKTVPFLCKEKRPLFIIKSTVPPGTVQEKILPYLHEQGLIEGKDVVLVNNPEFLREGHCWQDFIFPDRIVVGHGCQGSISTEASERMNALYAPFQAPVKMVSWNTAEYIKYLSNCLLAAMISFSNEMAQAADYIGDIHVAEAFRILHMDKRWNHCEMSAYVYPGCGYGGYCLPKDTLAMKTCAEEKGAPMHVLSSVINMNQSMAANIASRISSQITANQCIGILGLSFKPGSNDVRDCPSAKIIKELQKMGYHNFAAYDPVATEDFISVYGLGIDYCASLNLLIEKAEILVLLTAWPEFRDLHVMTKKKIMDFRYML